MFIEFVTIYELSFAWVYFIPHNNIRFLVLQLLSVEETAYNEIHHVRSFLII